MSLENGNPAAPGTLLLWSVILAGLSAVSMASVLIRMAQAPPLAISFYRVMLAALVLWPVHLCRNKGKARVWNGRTLALTFLSGTFLALHFAFWVQSLGMTSVASSVTLVSVNPLFIALFGRFFLGERPSAGLWLGVGCAFLGSALVAGSDCSFSSQALKGDLLALLGAVMASGYLLAGRAARSSLDLAAYTAATYGTAALVLLLLCALWRTPIWGFSAQTYAVLAALALVPQLIGHTAFNWSLRFLPPTVVAVLILGEPVGATFLAWLIFGEGLSVVKGAGLLILGTGIVVSARSASTGGGKE